LRAKTVEIKVVKKPAVRISIKYTCPKCKCNFEEHGFYEERITRFLCSCGQEIIAKYST